MDLIKKHNPICVRAGRGRAGERRALTRARPKRKQSRLGEARSEQRVASRRVLISRVAIKRYSSVTLPARKLLGQRAQRVFSFLVPLGIALDSASTDFGRGCLKQNKIDRGAFQLKFSRESAVAPSLK